jgi:hypothetical protein
MPKASLREMEEIGNWGALNLSPVCCAEGCRQNLGEWGLVGWRVAKLQMDRKYEALRV